MKVYRIKRIDKTVTVLEVEAEDAKQALNFVKYGCYDIYSTSHGTTHEVLNDWEDKEGPEV